MTTSRAFAALGVLAGLSLDTIGAFANENVVGRARSGIIISEDAAASAALRPQRFFSDPRLLPEKVQTNLGIRSFQGQIVGTFALPIEEFNGKSHPFTTKFASAKDSISPVDKFPWSATGKMIMRFNGSTAQCTASVIRKNLLVTAAHCVHDYGAKEGGFAEAITFEPARHGNGASARPFGTWVAKEWWIPKAYFEGKDVCDKDAIGIVCENDVAVIVLEKNSNGQFVSDLTGQFDFKSDDYGYGVLFSNKVGQFTQLGYPADKYDGIHMTRTDTLGYQEIPNNVIIGSAQTGGSSGGPWLMNFGVKTSYTGPHPIADDDNVVVATTSWGFTDPRFMIQGGSRFGKNSTYTQKSNIQSLVDSACGANPGFC